MKRRHYNLKRKRRWKYSIYICFTTLLLTTITVFAVKTTRSTPAKITSNESKDNANEYKDHANEDEMWNLILVNVENSLPKEYEVMLTNMQSGHAIDHRINSDLQKMMNDAKKAGLSPLICSSYRTNEKQEELFNNQVKTYLAEGYSQEEAKIEAKKWVAFPGTSEHQTGLAVDIVASDYQLLDEKQENTNEQKWLMENSYRYGFVLRYPEEKSNITGINYEPWHYRYVGKEAAKEMYEQELCLEEYLKKERRS